ncbi:unnamed protein product [Protopolystoma xenopodis]|uniref:U-box domain-containing protein n=1 Tax=Protopolystoma xenopodis TaxID=117903 RepID=A0A3S5A2Q4_9PLAT|nr:unnamed protein product [Protopolystoma xenopodis]
MSVPYVYEEEAKQLREEEEEADLDDAPEAFIDPIMGHLMENPVKLPSSGQIVDRKTIYQHLLKYTPKGS